MIRVFCILLLVILGVDARSETGSAKAQDVFDTPPYRMRVSLFENLTQHRDVIMLGDSITARGEWSELTGYTSIANRGIGGDNALGVFRRLDPLILMNPNKVFVMVGINDLIKGRAVDDILTDYKYIVSRLNEAGAVVYVQSTLYVSRRSRLKFNSGVTMLNYKMKEFCDRSRTCIYIDLNSILASKGRLDGKYTADGVHLNGDGYLAWAHSLRKYLESNSAAVN